MAGKNAWHWDTTSGNVPAPSVPDPPICSALAPLAGQRCSEPRTRVKRLLGTALVLSACGFGPLAALGAALGWLTRKRLRPLSNHAHGMRWANVAICVGALNSTLWVGAWTWITLEPPNPPTTPVEVVTSPFVTHPLTLPSYRDFPELETLPVAMDDGSAQEATWTRFIGRVLLTDVGNGVRSLSVTLEEQAALARRRRRTPVLWLVASDCERCDEMTRRLETPVLQRAFSSALLIRVDAEQFASELAEIHLLEAPLPAFAPLSSDGTPVDFLHAGEWRGRSIERMAPLLETFVKRRPIDRRFPWRGGPRLDETPI